MSLASQLSRLAAPTTGGGDAARKKKNARASVLYTAREAADVSLDAIHEAALEGLGALMGSAGAAIFERFSEPLFSPRARQINRELLGASLMAQHDFWAVPGGDADQGLLVYVFLALLRGQTFHDVTIRKRGWVAMHFWAGDKPWLPRKTCLPYFEFMDDRPDLLAPASSSQRPTPCVRHLAVMRRRLLSRWKETNGTGHFRCRAKLVRVL